MRERMCMCFCPRNFPDEYKKGDTPNINNHSAFWSIVGVAY